jgi:hypothetical protein
LTENKVFESITPMNEQHREFLNAHYREQARAERRAEQWKHNFGVDVETVEETSETSETKVLTTDKNQVG